MAGAASGALSLLTGAPAAGPQLRFWPLVGCWPYRPEGVEGATG